MLRRKWKVTVVFETNDKDNAEGYVKKYEEVLELLKTIESLILQKGKELDFVQFHRNEGGVIHLEARTS